MTAAQTHSDFDSPSAIRENICQMPGYTPGEQVNNAIKLNTNECPWPASPRALAALHNIDEKSLRQYPSPDCRDLRTLAANIYNCQADEILVGNGSDDCLTIIYRSFLNADDHVVSPWPSYGLYDTLAHIQGVDIIHCDFVINDPLSAHYTWSLPTDIPDDSAKICLLANPNNPSGTHIPVADIVSFCARSKGIVVVDEAYVDFASDAEQRAGLIPYINQLPNVIVLRTFSKSYSLAGARVGLLFANSALIRQLNKVKDSYNVNVISQILAVEALGDQEHHRQLVSRSLASRRNIERYCRDHGWTFPASEANFILCDVGKDAESIYKYLKLQGILIRWWNSPQLRNKLRISTGTEHDMRTLFGALDTFVSNTPNNSRP